MAFKIWGSLDPILIFLAHLRENLQNYERRQTRSDLRSIRLTGLSQSTRSGIGRLRDNRGNFFETSCASSSTFVLTECSLEIFLGVCSCISKHAATGPPRGGSEDFYFFRNNENGLPKPLSFHCIYNAIHVQSTSLLREYVGLDELKNTVIDALIRAKDTKSK